MSMVCVSAEGNLVYEEMEANDRLDSTAAKKSKLL